jgi:hypothetical protein
VVFLDLFLLFPTAVEAAIKQNPLRLYQAYQPVYCFVVCSIVEFAFEYLPRNPEDNSSDRADFPRGLKRLIPKCFFKPDPILFIGKPGDIVLMAILVALIEAESDLARKDISYLLNSRVSLVCLRSLAVVPQLAGDG